MKLDIDALDETRDLTMADLPGLTEGDAITVYTMKDYVIDSEAQVEASSMVRPDPEDEDPDDPGEQVKVDPTKYQRGLFMRMVKSFHLSRPNGESIDDTPANREKLFRALGADIMAILLRSGGAVDKTIPGGKADPETGKSPDVPAGG